MANPMLSWWYRLYTKQTPAEQKFETILCKFGVRYRCQHIMLNINCFPDFFLPDYNLVIEIDDPSHLKPEKIKKDREHTKALSGLGIKVIRFTNDEILNGSSVPIIKKLRSMLDASSNLDSVHSAVPKTPTTPIPHLSSTPETVKKRGRPRKTPST